MEMVWALNVEYLKFLYASLLMTRALNICIIMMELIVFIQPQALLSTLEGFCFAAHRDGAPGRRAGLPKPSGPIFQCLQCLPVRVPGVVPR